MELKDAGQAKIQDNERESNARENAYVAKPWKLDVAKMRSDGAAVDETRAGSVAHGGRDSDTETEGGPGQIMQLTAP